ncbi:MAG: D-aminoacyl-tRNA deacylase [Lishizhenia sp.]
MRVILQRVKKAKVSVDNNTVGKINNGLLVFLGVGEEDTEEDVQWLTNKIIGLRIFSDEKDKMNHSVKDIKGEILVVSQFTLFASTKKGNRPSFTKSAHPTVAIPLYENFIAQLKVAGLKVETGKFGADMQVELLNDGPVTIQIDSKNKA